MDTNNDITRRCIDTVRVLAADAVQKANSGHPGTPMATAPIGHLLWTEFMHYNPRNPHWPNRDRFILSAGHACLLQYIYLHLTGYDTTMEDLKNFRQLHSKTAGHPEYGLLNGIEVTTGPLGQGFANSVGFGIAQKWLAARYNKPGFPVFDYTIYCLCSDGDLMEGISSEAASIAGHLKLNNLIYLYDDNHISIEGKTEITFTDDTVKRFEAYGWYVQSIGDVNDLALLSTALQNAKNETDRPSLIRVRTHIAFGSPNKVDTAGAHGAPLGEEEVKLVKKNLGFDPDKSFVVPEEVATYYKKIGERGIQKEKEWSALYKSWKEKYPAEVAEYELWTSGKLPTGWKEKLPVFKPADGKIATRKASGKVLNAIAADLPFLMGGAADLAPSTDTLLEKVEAFTPDHPEGRNFHFGVREHAMGAILNGLALTPGFIPYGATFLLFSDYMRPPVRLAAIMKIKPIFIYTHDSIGLGEDGTTHQPIEQLAALRAIPNITLIRPADANETVQAWRVALQHKGGPVLLVLTRQSLPVIDRSRYADASELERGAYILAHSSGDPHLILIGTGSEVHLLLEAREKLEEEDIPTRVVSMPSWELFEQQDAVYKNQVLPKEVRHRVVVEAAGPQGWHKYATGDGIIICMHSFGESAPGEALMKVFGFTAGNIVHRAKALLQPSLA
ncbi:MAG TPA: transketolase [Chitinophagaceae bacterium]|jgi:transketolase